MNVRKQYESSGLNRDELFPSPQRVQGVQRKCCLASGYQGGIKAGLLPLELQVALITQHDCLNRRQQRLESERLFTLTSHKRDVWPALMRTPTCWHDSPPPTP